MSVIFGIIKKEGVFLEKQEFEQRYSSVKHFPQDNFSLWTENNIGLGWVQLYDTPESVYDKQPFSFGNQRFIMIGKARLDNRKELCDIFNITAEERIVLPDTKLLQFAFEKWGEKSPAKIFGDWSFAIWDKFEKKLFIARDHQGVSVIYYSVTNDFIAFSSNKSVLLSISTISKEINKVQIAQLLVGWNGYADETVYRDILRLPPACSAIYQNRKLLITKYWQLENVANFRLKNDDEYLEVFNDLFLKAIKSRIRSYRDVASMLSGGIDSSSVTAIAAAELVKESKKITGYTSVPKYNVTDKLKDFQFGDESLLAEQVSKSNSNIIHELINSDKKNPLQGLVESISILNSPVRNSSNYFWLLSITEKAKQNNIGTLLTGQGGNFTISWPFRGYYSSFIQPGLKPYLRKKAPYFLIKLIAELKKGKKPYLKKSFINNKFESEINLLERMKDAGFDPFFLMNYSLKKMRLNTLKINMAQGAGNTQEIGDYFGLNIYDPTMDIKLLEYCYGIPDNQFVRPGNDRHLISRAMQNRLPSELLFNDKKGVQASDLLFRVKENIENYLRIIIEMNNSEICKEIIDVNKLKRTALEIENNFEKIVLKRDSGFLRAINVGLFLINKEK